MIEAVLSPIIFTFLIYLFTRLLLRNVVWNAQKLVRPSVVGV